jgi:asparagine synthase (glutamine-hydrolysing)
MPNLVLTGHDRGPVCGITGLFDTRGKRPVDDGGAAPHERRLAERPPRARRRQPAHRARRGLGHRRLSIIDVATGQQPLFNEDGSVVIVFNGEIYNYQELIPSCRRWAMCSTPRATPRSSCTPGSLGRGLRQALRGMFAFALWDRNRQTFFMARDRLGVKPMYYALLDDGTLLFGSELKSLLAHGGLRATSTRWRSRSTSRWATWPSRAPSSSQARKLPPGHTLLVRRGQPSRSRANTGTCASRSTTRSVAEPTRRPSWCSGCASRCACA